MRTLRIRLKLYTYIIYIYIERLKSLRVTKTTDHFVVHKSFFYLCVWLVNLPSVFAAARTRINSDGTTIPGTRGRSANPILTVS